MNVLSKRVTRWLRWLFVVPLRVFLVLPLVLLANIFWALSQLFEVMGDGMDSARKVMHPITIIPYVADWKRQIEELEEDKRLRVLRQLRDQNDT